MSVEPRRIHPPNAGGTVASIEEGRFPVIQLSGSARKIRVFGFVHGHGDEFKEYGGETRKAMDKAMVRFQKGDYILVEGYEDDLLSKVTGEQMTGKVRDHIAEGLIAGRPRLRFCERFEWYYMGAESKEEIAILEAEKMLWSFIDAARKILPTEAQGSVREVGQASCFNSGDVEWAKSHDAAELMKLTGLPEEKVMLYVEKHTTLRSLLAARTALWRANFADVNLFVGALHVEEIVKFIVDRAAVDGYIENLHEKLRSIYDNNEETQEEIAGLFTANRREAIWPNLANLFLRWLAYKVYEANYGLNPERKLNFAEYRSEMEDLLRSMKRNDPCLCFSGEKFKHCCGA